jgi:hypothetical protein
MSLIEHLTNNLLLPLLALLIIITVQASPQTGWRPATPPDACFRRNDTIPACPYGGQCSPMANYTCQTACVNYQDIDAKYYCTIKCGYKATTLTGNIAPNPLLCIQPTFRNGLTCDSGWACYRRFGTMPPLFKTQGPVCSPNYVSCDPTLAQNVTSSTNSTTIEGDCDAGSRCVVDPRSRLALPAKIEETGICVTTAKTCSGEKWDECGERSHCVVDSQCTGTLGKECTGFCVAVLGPTWGTVNGSTLSRRWANDKMC